MADQRRRSAGSTLRRRPSADRWSAWRTRCATSAWPGPGMSFRRRLDRPAYRRDTLFAPASTGLSRRSSRRQAARSRPARRRRAQVEPSRRSRPPWPAAPHSSSPWRDHRSRSASHAPSSSSRGRSRPSRSSIETIAVATPPGASSDAIPADAGAASSSARAPRSSEPHGKRIVSSSATPSSSSGTRSAAATTKSAFVGPPRDARRDDSAIDAALASIPMTRAPGSERARPRTARPSPVPRSTTTRSAWAIRWWS